MEGNLLFNCVRESGDHGPFNSWDRVPFITNGGMVRNTSKPAVGGSLPGHDMADGPSVVPLFRRISNNFIVGLYNSQESIDNDDGSSYYLTHNNYFTYGLRGLKGGGLRGKGRGCGGKSPFWLVLSPVSLCFVFPRSTLPFLAFLL